MLGTIPVMRVNYTTSQLIGSLFITERSTKYRERLKRMLQVFFGVDDVLLTSSARCAIYMIVRSLSQTKVIVPAYTCEVVIEAIKLAGKEVVFAPVSKKTLNISEYPVIDSNTIVLATHQYGFPSEMDNLVELCRGKGAVLVEDCAGSFGGRIDDKLTGTFGDYAVFSFSASKTLHSPTKGGFIIARNKELLDKILPITNQPNDRLAFKIRQFAKAIGFCLAKRRLLSSWLFSRGQTNSCHTGTEYLTDSSYHRGLYEWQAYVLSKQLTCIESILMERRELYRRYYNSIKNPLFLLEDMNLSGVFIRFPILVSDRDRFLEYCCNKHIAVGTGYNRLYCPSSYNTAHEISKEIVYLPFGNGFSAKEINKVISVVNSFR
jgi:dTDP-4-amino-4,6-dideoxygalactose transaminase